VITAFRVTGGVGDDIVSEEGSEEGSFSGNFVWDCPECT
jgi:hypothetical protein